MKLLKIISLDLNQSVNEVIQAKQNDVESRAIQFNITNDIDLTGHTARVYMVKPDSTRVFNDCVIVDKSITADLTSQALAVPGMVSSELVIYGADGSVFSTKPFKVYVEGSIRNTAAIESTNEYTALDNALITLGQYQADIDGIKADATDQVDTLITTKTSEINAVIVAKTGELNAVIQTEQEALDTLYTTKETELNDLYTTEQAELDTLQLDYSNRAENLETTYAPRLNEVESHLADLATDSDGAHGLKIETGTFTPSLLFGGNSVGLVYATSGQSGKYYKIGNVVSFVIDLVLVNKGTSVGNAIITGMPFVNSNVNVACIGAYGSIAHIANATDIHFTLLANGNSLNVRYLGNNINMITGATNAEFANNSAIRLFGQYFV